MSEDAPGDRAARERRLRAERGALLARRGAGRTAAAATRPYLVCACGPERYGLLLDAVSAVLPMRACTPVPGAVPALLGLAALSGRIVGVLGLARALNRPGPDPEAGHLVRLHPIAHRPGTRQLGPHQLGPQQLGAHRPGAGSAALDCALAVDRALGVVHLPADAIRLPGAAPGPGLGGSGLGDPGLDDPGLGDEVVLGYAPGGPEAAGLGDFAILDLPPLLRRALP